MSRFRNVEEVLRIPAPKMVTQLAARGVGRPLVRERGLNSVWQLHKVNHLRCEYSQEEGSFFFFFLSVHLCVRHNYVVNILFILLGSQV